MGHALPIFLLHFLSYSYNKRFSPSCVRDFLLPTASISSNSELKSLGGTFVQAFSDTKG